MRYLLDTCVISEVVKAKPSANVLNWLDSVDENRLFISVLTLGEIQKGISGMPDGNRQLRLQSWLDKDLAVRFRSRVVTISEDISLDWGLLSGQAKKEGFAAPVIDTLLAATARNLDLALVTRNISDFKPFGVHLLNPWLE